tara:strand:+ start:1869 stop:2132 length:264 start_codon:yes stop_codon:yes gene_type:complete
MDKSLQISENITFQSIDNCVYILNINNGEYYKLSESASMIWKEIEKEKNIDDIKIKIKSFFIENNEIDRDVDKLLNDLINLGLIKDN